MTAHAFPACREACLDAGMDDFLTKPIRLHEPAEAIQRIGRQQEAGLILRPL